MTQIKGFKINNTLYNHLNITEFVSHLNSKNRTDFIIKAEDDGSVYTTQNIEGQKFPDQSLDENGKITDKNKKADIYKFNGETKFFINSFYCGGIDANEHTINYCSHNFVELSNLTTVDIDLSNFSLQYSSENGNDWKVLPLKGVIKAGSTFLIRGAQCSVLSSPTTKIIVDKYDMEWEINGTDGKNELIKFSTTQGKFYLTLTTLKCDADNPYSKILDDKAEGMAGYIDLVGFTDGEKGNIDSCEKNPNTNLSPKHLMRRYYSMDNGDKATKAKGKRNNAVDWTFIDLSLDDGDLIYNIEAYTPQPSYGNKNLFYDKSKLLINKPSIITCSFGIQATDNGQGATRCFNWVCHDLTTRFIWISQDKNNWGLPNETFYTGDNRTIYNDEETKINGVSIYDRIIQEYTNNTTLVINKFIKSGLTAGTWYYIAGRKKEDGSPDLEYCTDIRSFVVRTNSAVESGFTFVQTTDQQGFIWDEYRLWNGVSKLIEKEEISQDISFMINTGDMTQNGNRLSEWLDYFNGKSDYLNNMEEMATIGNNDLCESTVYEITKGGDNNKLWPENIKFFYTFEADKNNPPIFTVNEKKYFIPSLYSYNYGNVHFMCLNSEIKDQTETAKGGFNFGDGNYGNFYPKIKEWCEKDINGLNTAWNIAYCHEMPFTIMTTGNTSAPTTLIEKGRGGSSMNTNLKSPSERYWFSEFCQTHKIPLVIGGHKHTQATSWPLLENVSYDGSSRNVDSLHPIIILKNIKDYDEKADSLVEIGNFKYPNTWVENGEVKELYKNKAMLCTFKLASEIDENTTPVIYAMSQASGYKHTSNKELPSKDVPWLKYSHGINDNADKANPTQQYPFYTIWKVTPNKIEGNVRALFGGFNDKGKFNINFEGKYLKNWKCANTSADGGHKGLIDNTHTHEIFSINGITSNLENVETNETKIEVFK